MSTNVNVRQRTNIAISAVKINEKRRLAVGRSMIVKCPRQLVWDQEVVSSNPTAPTLNGDGSEFLSFWQKIIRSRPSF